MSATVLPSRLPGGGGGGPTAAAASASAAAAAFQTAGAALASSLIFPPADLRGIIEKTAQFVAKNGAEFEQRVRREQNNQRFAFLFPNNPYHAYYQLKVREYTTGEEAPRPQVPQAILDMRKREEEKAKRKEKLLMLTQYGDQGQAEEKQKKKAIEPPPPEVYSVVQPYIAAIDVEVIQTTAQFVARNGQRFLSGLAQRERQNPQFEFLKPTHALFQYFTNLVDAYTKCLLPPAEQTEKIKEAAANPQNALKRCMQRFLWELEQEKQRKEKDAKQAEERALMHAIDWHDFYVVETIDFTEEDDMLPLAAPIDFSAAAARRPPPTALAGLEDEGTEADEEADAEARKQPQQQQQQQRSIAALIREAADAAGGVDDEDDLDIEDEIVKPTQPPAAAPPAASPTLPAAAAAAPAPGVPAPAAAPPGGAPAAATAGEKTSAGAAAPAGAPAAAPAAPEKTLQQQQPPQPKTPAAPAAAAKGKTDEEHGEPAEEEDDLLLHHEAAAAAAMARPAVRIVKGYVRQPRKRGGVAAATVVGGEQPGEKGLQKCPITGQLVPADQMSQHLRILLLDPKWKEQKEKFLEKAKADSAFAPMGDVEGNLALFVAKRPDLFGSVDEQVVVEDTSVTGNAPVAAGGTESSKIPPGPLLPTPTPQPGLLPAPPLKRYRTAAEAAAAGNTATAAAPNAAAAASNPAAAQAPAGVPFALTVICEEGGGLEAQEMIIEVTEKVTFAALKESLLEAGMGLEGLRAANLIVKDAATGAQLADWRTIESYGLHRAPAPRVILSASR